VTPFGEKVREHRRRRGMTLTRMAQDLQLSPAYLSALERGRRGRPSPVLVDQICAYFHIIWDEADELRQLARLSHPRVVIDTSGLNAAATLLANRLAEGIGRLPPERIDRLLRELARAGA